MRKINHLVIHCSSTLQATGISNIQSYWNDVLQWQNPVFHYIICVDGKVVQMLGIERAVDGSAAQDSHSINIAYIGGIDALSKPVDNRTGAQKDALLRLLRDLKEQFPKAKIQGFRDFFKDKNKAESADTWNRINQSPCFNAIPEYSHL